MQPTAHDESPHTGAGGDAVVAIDRSLREAFIFLEALDRRMLATVTPPLTSAQYHALAALARVPTQSLGELAARLLCDKANASGLITRLDSLGLVDRTRDPADARRVVLSLTPAGRDALAKAAHARQTALLRALAALHTAELTTITRAIAQLAALLQAAVSDD